MKQDLESTSEYACLRLLYTISVYLPLNHRVCIDVSLSHHHHYQFSLTK